MTDTSRPAPSKNEPSRSSVIELSVIQQGENLLYDARLLHRDFKVKTKFADWIKGRIAEYGFERNVDFFASEISEAKRGGHNRIDYLLTLDMCKELGMLERSEVGKAIRKKFIEKEKQLRSISQLPRETTLFKGVKAKRINDRVLYPYREVLVRCGYNANNNGNRRHRYWMHFIKDGTILYVTEEFAIHLYRQKQVLHNRAAMLASQPVLPLHFGGPIV